MRKKRLIAAMAVSAMMVAATVGTTLAYFTDKDSKSNVVTMGKVDGTLTESNVPKDAKGQKYDNVKPGDTIKKDPKVTLAKDSENAYVRLKVDYKGLNKEQCADLDSAIKSALNKGWVLGDDGYYYYNEILKAKESTTAFKSFDIPASWGNEMADLTFYVNVTAEFIQAEHFTPKYTDETKKVIADWGTVSIDSYKKN